MKIFLTFILVFAQVFCNAQNTFLYEISHPKQKHVSYLFGTIHVQNAEVYSFNDSVLIAIENSNKSLFELDMTSKENLMQLANVFKTKKYQKFMEHLADYVKNDLLPKLVDSIPAPEMAKIIKEKLFVEIEKLLSKKNQLNLNTNIIDVHLQKYSQLNGKEIIALETFEEQLDAILGDILKINLYKQKITESIIKALKNNESFSFDFDKYIGKDDSMIKHYSNFRIDKIDEMMMEMAKSKNKFERRLYKKLIVDRNEIMFKRSISLVKSEPTFIAVGAGHLTGQNGLINLYKKAGYTVRPVRTDNLYTRKIEWNKLETQFYTVEIPSGIAVDTSETFDFLWIEEKTDLNKFYLHNGMAEFYIHYNKAEDSTGIFGIEEEYMQEYPEFDSEESLEEDTEYEEIEAFEYEEATYIDSIQTDIEFSETENNMNENTVKKSSPLSRLLPGIDEEKYTKYFTELSDSLKDFFASKGNVILGLENSYSRNEDTIILINNMGNEIKVTYSKTTLYNTKTYTIRRENGDTIDFVLVGDKAVLENPELDLFFKSIRIK